MQKLGVKNCFLPKYQNQKIITKTIFNSQFKHLSSLVASFGYFPLLMTESNVKKKPSFLFGGSLWFLSVAGGKKHKKKTLIYFIKVHKYLYYPSLQNKDVVI